jgi:carboxypeptidase PM20D1
MKRTAAVLGLGLLVVAAALLYRTARFTSRQLPAEAAAPFALDTTAAAERLAGAIRFRTISYQDSSAFHSNGGAEFSGFQDYLRRSFPKLHARLKREVTNGYSLLYEWRGTDTTLKPILLLAHQDVVPVEAGTESRWTEPPFAGRIAGGYVWGRGAMDDKSNLMAVLEAVERLIADGVTPRRTVYLAFGHHEEVGGHGAARTAALLAARHVRLEYVLDEGGAIATGLVPGIPGPVALVGIAEKGYLSLELLVEAEGGHSSMPPAQTAAGILSAAVARLEARQMPRHIRGATAAMLDYIGPEMAFSIRLAVANRWLFGGLIERRFGAAPSGNAMLRTTTAPTMLQAGVKDNVLPSSARAVVNFRILPGDSVAGVLTHTRQTIDDPRVTITVLAGNVNEPSPVSPVASEDFRLLQRTLGQVAPGAVVTPWLVLGGTDSRQFTGLTSNVYRTGAGGIGPEDLARVHGTDERVSVKDYARSIAFYVQLIRNTAL